jgi:hypothetical protein
MSHALYRLGRLAARRPWFVNGAWLVSSALVVGGSAAFGHQLEDSRSARFVAMGLPIGMALFGLALGISAMPLITRLVYIPAFAPQMATMIGIGVGIDYAMFLVARHREHLARQMTIEESIGRAVARRGGPTGPRDGGELRPATRDRARSGTGGGVMPMLDDRVPLASRRDHRPPYEVIVGAGRPPAPGLTFISAGPSAAADRDGR